MRFGGEEVNEKLRTFEVFSSSWEINDQRSTKSISINYTNNWDIQIEEYLTGDDIEEMYGDWDHEEFVLVKRVDAPRLMTLLMKYAFGMDNPLTFSKLKDLLNEAGINFENNSWA